MLQPTYASDVVDAMVKIIEVRVGGERVSVKGNGRNGRNGKGSYPRWIQDLGAR